jgi:nitrite reductase/ring-hydroxylating ferredoxin subunit/uncharacterized membrane protein
MANEDVTGGDDPRESSRQRAIAERLQRLIHRAFENGPTGQKIKNFLNGTWIGHPLHVILTDVPIGAWTAAEVFDVLEVANGSDGFRKAADTSIAIGIIGALGAAVTGATDWQDADAPARRIGMIHGALNLSGAALFTTSWLMRKRGSRTAGRLLSALAYAGMTYSAHLGGNMVYNYRLGVDRTAGQSFPEEFVSVLSEAELSEDTPTRVEHEGVPILLVKRRNRIFALAETCSHFSGPLSEGKLIGNSIQCPWHRSCFALEDGRVLNGPAVHPQPCLEARVHNGHIEIRKRPGRQAQALAAKIGGLRPVA